MLQELVKYMAKDLVMIVPNNSKNPKIHEYKVSKIRVKNKKYYIPNDNSQNERMLKQIREKIDKIKKESLVSDKN